MDACSTFICGCLLLSGGLLALVSSLYGCLTVSGGAFGATEVLLCGCVVALGAYLLARSLPKLLLATDDGCEAPFYYELEPQRRGLPPVPRDIGRDYDPVVLDRV